MGPVRTGIGLRVSVIAAAVGAAAVLSACSATTNEADVNLVAGKQLFVQKCGSCHILSRAGSKGVTGPDLDQAFQQSLKDGMERDGIRGAVHAQILHPRLGSVMPAKLVTGDDAESVAAYVASVVAKSGKDEGLLATAVKQAGGGKPAAAANGTLEIDADPGGQLAYVTNQATAPAGELTVKSVNKSGTPHDIVIDGKGKGEEVSDGGTSEFAASFAAGTYTFYCSVPGHRQAGMEGKLVVK
jgi:uncharacterized cupredoxin-like copper-binding protein